MQGFLNLHKPHGLTSHDCVARVRKLLRMKRVGHGGTLDPAAMGVLPIALGKATRLLQYLRHDKAYIATIRFGVKTTTDDLEGEVLTQNSANWLELEKVKSYLPQFEGTIQQIPPSYSAIQVGGKRLYDLARSGEVVEAPVRSVAIHSIEVLDWRSGEFSELEVAISCGTGTYIRSIARDLGDLLGVGGTLAKLIRTCSSGFVLEDSLTLEALTERIESNSFQPIPPETALQHLNAIDLTPDQAKRWNQGQKIVWAEVPPFFTGGQTLCRVQAGDRFLGIGAAIVSQDQPMIVPKLVWDVEV